MRSSPPRTARAGPAPAAPAAAAPPARWILALVFLAGVLVYANSLSNGFTFDDKVIVEHNPKIRSLDRLPEIWSSPYWPRHRYIQNYRPLTLTTYALNYAVHGVAPFGFHLVNVILHGLVSAMVVALAFRLGLPPAASALAGLFFAVHPIHTEVVAGVVGRAELLASLAYIGGFLLWLRYRAGGRMRDLAALVAVFVLGNLAKEHVVVLPFVLAGAELSFHRFRDRVGNRRLLRAFLGCAAAGILVFLLRNWATGTPFAGNLLAHPITSGLLYGEPAKVRVLTFLKVLLKVARLFVFPITLSPDYNFDQIPIPRGMEPAVAGGLAVAAAGVLIAARAWRTPRRFAMLAWAGLTYFPVSNLLVPLPLLLAERTLYIPSIGLAVLLGDWIGGGTLWERAGRQRVAAILSAAVVLLWGARTVARNPVWHDQLSLFRAAVEASPNSATMQLGYGRVLLKNGRKEEAVAHLEKAVRIQPELAMALYQLSMAYQELNEPGKAEEAIRSLLRFRPDRPTPWLQLGRVLLMQGRTAEAASALRRSLAFDPRNEEARALLESIEGSAPKPGAQ